jgi:hypothetical protein
MEPYKMPTLIAFKIYTSYYYPLPPFSITLWIRAATVNVGDVVGNTSQSIKPFLQRTLNSKGSNSLRSSRGKRRRKRRRRMRTLSFPTPPFVYMYLIPSPIVYTF